MIAEYSIINLILAIYSLGVAAGIFVFFGRLICKDFDNKKELKLFMLSVVLWPIFIIRQFYIAYRDIPDD